MITSCIQTKFAVLENREKGWRGLWEGHPVQFIIPCPAEKCREGQITSMAGTLELDNIKCSFPSFPSLDSMILYCISSFLSLQQTPVLLSFLQLCAIYVIVSPDTHLSHLFLKPISSILKTAFQIKPSRTKGLLQGFHLNIECK